MLSRSELATKENIESETKRLVNEAIDSNQPVLVEAPPAAGKSTAIFELAKEIDSPISYFVSRTDLYEKADQKLDSEPDINSAIIPSPQRLCETFKGENDGEKAKAEILFSKGISGPKIHYSDDVYTPCSSDGESCKYLEVKESIKEGLKNGNIDFLIGNHKHSLNNLYVDDRIVIFDEFNPDPFVTEFPEQESVDHLSHPGKIIFSFLKELGESNQDFPTEDFADLTDILLRREDAEDCGEAIDWFVKNGVKRSEVEDYDFYDISSYKYDTSHISAPLLTFCLFCMRKVGPGIELAPPPENYKLQKIRDAWEDCGLGNTRVVRNRNTGNMYLLQPPEVSSAKQVIGLDAFPPKILWDLIFGGDREFNHQRVIKREHFSDYLESTMNLTVKQIGDGKNPYAGGRISEKDQTRFAVINAIEGEKFALISTKKAIEQYDSRRWLHKYTKSSSEYSEIDELVGGSAVLNYHKIKSSNIFEKEDLGVVSGSPQPGYDVIQVWAGFLGEQFEPPFKGIDSIDNPVIEELFRYFNQYQIIQAVLRFGRDESVYEKDGSTVYVNTTDLPSWIQPSQDLSIQKRTKANKIIEYLIRAKESSDRIPFPEQTTISISEELNLDRTYVHRILERLVENGYVKKSGTGKDGATIYVWDRTDLLLQLGNSDEYGCQLGEDVYIIESLS